MQDIDAHRDIEREQRLLAVAGDARIAGELDDAVARLDRAAVHGHRGDAAAAPMVVEQMLVRERRQHVGVEEHERLAQVAQQRDRPDRAERSLLERIRDREPRSPLRLFEVRLDQVGPVPEREVHAAGATGLDLAEQNLDDRMLAEADQRFGNGERVRLQPRAHALSLIHI
jgi:hypothetical protein